jgi:hypothetical protein
VPGSSVRQRKKPKQCESDSQRNKKYKAYLDLFL